MLLLVLVHAHILLFYEEHGKSLLQLPTGVVGRGRGSLYVCGSVVTVRTAVEVGDASCSTGRATGCTRTVPHYHLAADSATVPAAHFRGACPASLINLFFNPAIISVISLLNKVRLNLKKRL